MCATSARGKGKTWIHICVGYSQWFIAGSLRAVLEEFRFSGVCPRASFFIDGDKAMRAVFNGVFCALFFGY